MCIFCDIVNKKVNSWTIYQDEYVSAFFDYNPASKGHVIVVPNEHYPNLFETPNEILGKIIALAKKIAVFYKNEWGIENINIVQSNGKFAGQEVFHYHMHIIPRSENDNINFHWKPNINIRDEFDKLKDKISKGINN